MQLDDTCDTCIGNGKLNKKEPGVLTLAFNRSTNEAEAGDFCRLEVSLIYTESSRTAKVTQRDQASKTNKNLESTQPGNQVPKK